MKLLFVCNLGRNRSRTAADMLGKKHETRYAGIYSENDPVTNENLIWADRVFCMGKEQQEWIRKNFPDASLRKDIRVLNIPNDYFYGQDELMDLLKEKLEEYFS